MSRLKFGTEESATKSRFGVRQAVCPAGLLDLGEQLPVDPSGAFRPGMGSNCPRETRVALRCGAPDLVRYPLRPLLLDLAPFDGEGSLLERSGEPLQQLLGRLSIAICGIRHRRSRRAHRACGHASILWEPFDALACCLDLLGADPVESWRNVLARGMTKMRARLRNLRLVPSISLLPPSEEDASSAKPDALPAVDVE